MEGFINEAPNPDLSKLNDRQDMALTQLSYLSDEFAALGTEVTISDFRKYLIESGKSTPSKLEKLDYALSAGLGSLKIKAVENSDTGFGAIAFEDTYGNTGFSFRGTDVSNGVYEFGKDMGDNVSAMLTGDSTQSEEALAFFEKYSDPTGNNYLYGHSKGGELSEYVYVHWYNKIQAVHLLNPQPINPFSLTLEQFKALQSKKVDIIIIEGDYVWFLGILPTYGSIRIAKGNGKNAHGYGAAVFNNDGTIAEGTMPWWEFVAYTAIVAIVGVKQLEGAIKEKLFDIAYHGAVAIVEFVKNDLIPRAKLCIEEVKRLIIEIHGELKEVAAKIGDFLNETIDRVKEWAKNNLNPGYVYAKANSYINVDTAKLHRYAERLRSVNRRISDLDRQMDSLYWQVGFLDLLDLIHADILTGHSWRIDRCINYLTSTAADFEAVERAIAGKL